METAQLYDSGEVVGDNPGDLREAVAELPQQLDASMSEHATSTEPVIEIDGQRIRPRDLFLGPDTKPGRLIRYANEHRLATTAIGVVTVGAVLVACREARSRLRQRN
jgi:hypothetical protein